MAFNLNWSAAWDYLRTKLSAYQLLDEQPSGRFAWKERSYVRRLKIPLIIIGSIFALLTLLWLFSGSHKQTDQINHRSYMDARLGPHWHGWSNVQQMVVFGDSWSTTSFDINGPPPSPESPIGVPKWPGETVGNGPNWVGYLTYKLNESLILTADFAIGGASVADLVHRDWRSVRSQVTRYYPPFNANHSFATPDTSLYFIWVGINDIHNAHNTTESFPNTFEVLAELMEDLYKTGGARNFMFINVPPMGRSPIATAGNLNSIWVDMVVSWNANLAKTAWDLADKHQDVTMFYFDGWQLFSDIMDDPCVMPESCGFKITEDYCPSYSLGNVEWNTFDPKCDFSADKYFWIDPLHPTTVLQNATAHAIYRAFKAVGD